VETFEVPPLISFTFRRELIKSGYARLMTRVLAVQNLEYAQADILKLGTVDRRFDGIEAVGVLHHLADPEAGWRALGSLLRSERTDAGRALQQVCPA
jgi:2-polyprenyl-3-methyl-5-hydroxy-6-metoxy-1,4-benzoquinol methylase